MVEGVTQYLVQLSLTQLGRDALDIFIVYYATYRVLLLVKGTRAQQVAVGLLFVFGLYVVAQFLQLVTVLSILSSLISSFILIVVVVFQGDIRRGLMRMGSRTWLPAQVRAQESMVIDEVVEAVTELARHRIGALIAFEQEASLDDFVGINKGKLLDAAVTSELLVSLFVPEAMNKLHDGAVIIRHLRIGKAGVFFPMPEGKALDQHFGSRHRAAVGITEETDAVVVVVSEERGTISCCFNGNIAPDLNGARLREMLESIFNPRPRRRSKSASSVRMSPTPAPGSLEFPEESVSFDDEVAPVSRIEQPPPTAGRPSRLLEMDAVWSDARCKPEESPLPLRPRGGAESDLQDQDTPPIPLRVSEPPPAPLKPRVNLPDGGPPSESPPPLRVRPGADLPEAKPEHPAPLRLRPDTASLSTPKSEPPAPLRARPSADARNLIPANPVSEGLATLAEALQDQDIGDRPTQMESAFAVRTVDSAPPTDTASVELPEGGDSLRTAEADAEADTDADADQAAPLRPVPLDPGEAK